MMNSELVLLKENTQNDLEGLPFIGRVIVPRQNRRDILSIEAFYRALGGIEPSGGRYALELHSSSPQVDMIIRASDAQLFERLKRLIETFWPQAEVHRLTPVNAPEVFFCHRRHYAASLRLSLREAAYLPIWSASTREGRSTYDDLQRGNDPMMALCGAITNEEEKKTYAIIQYVPCSLPKDWAKPWRGNTNDIGERLKFTPQNVVNIFLGLAGAVSILIAILLFLPLGLLTMRVGDFLLAGALGLTGIALMLLRAARPMPVDPLIVSQKASSNGFRVGVNVYVYSDIYENAVHTIERIVNAFAAYNLPNANGFAVHPSDSLSPNDYFVVQGRFDNTLTMLEMLFRSKKSPILSGIELSTMWHLPHESAAYQMMAYTTSRKLSIGALGFQSGHHLVGYVEHGSNILELKLSADDLKGNIAIFAGTRTGKSNLIALLAKIFLEDDPDCSMIVIDPHQTLAKQILSIMPESRRDKCIYWDLSNRKDCIGFNFIDRIRNVDNQPDRRMDNLVNGMREIWPNNWGPRTEDFLRHSLLTLLAANKLLVGEYLWRMWCYEMREIIHANKDIIEELLKYKDKNIDINKILSSNDVFSGFIRKINAYMTHLTHLNPSLFDPSSSITNYDDIDAFMPSHPTSINIYQEILKYRNEICKLNCTLADYISYLGVISRVVHSDYLLQNDSSRLTDYASVVDQKSLAEKFFYGRIFGNPPTVLQYNLLDVSVLLNDAKLQKLLLYVLPPSEHQLLSNWWINTYEKLAASGGRFAEMVAPIITKINAFAASHVSSRVFGQSISTIDLREVINNGWTLVVNTAIGAIGEDTAALIGSSLINWCTSIIYSRNREQSKRRVVIIIDEFHTMPGANYEALLSELGKYGAQSILATQSLAFLQKQQQQSGNKRYPVLENSNILVSFRCSAEDARTLSREFALAGTGNEDQMTVKEEDIVGLPSYVCYMRLRDRKHSPVVLRVKTIQAPDIDEELVHQISIESAKKYGRPEKEIADEIRISSRLSNVSSTLSQGGEPLYQEHYQERGAVI